jgi:tetratricopeptide (TPR) repeat protein
MVPQALEHREVEQAYRRHVSDFGADDFYVLIMHAAQFIDKMDVEEITAYLRLGLYSADFMGSCLGRLIEMAPKFERRQHAMVVDAIQRVSDSYFPVGERPDLHQGFGCLLYLIDEFESAASHFEKSLELYDPLPGALCNLAACYQQLGRAEEALSLLRRVLATEPNHEQANRLIQTFA